MKSAHGDTEGRLTVGARLAIALNGGFWKAVLRGDSSSHGGTFVFAWMRMERDPEHFTPSMVYKDLDDLVFGDPA